MVTAETTAASSMSELMANNEPGGSGIINNKPDTVSISAGEPETIAGDEKEENKSKEEADASMFVGTATFDGDLDAAKRNGKEDNAEEVSMEVRNEEKETLGFQGDKVESATTEDVQKNRETTSTTEQGVDEALAVSDSNVEGDSGMENTACQDLIEVNGLAGSPLNAITGTEKEETKDDANITGEAKIASKKKVKKIVKRKVLKRKAVAAVDESKSQLVEMQKPIVEVSANENEVKPDVNDGGKANKSRRVRKKKNAQENSKIAAAQPSENNEPAANKDVVRQDEPTSDGRVKNLRKKKKSGPEAAKVNAGEVATEGKDKAGQSTQNKSPKKSKTAGMIFMCSSKTRKECFQHKIFGLPAGKRDMVLNIYEGMRLFLFDFESKKLGGIYKAAGPGGYNIEPKAFNSGFPAQVRFTTLNECPPLPEEEFKTAIKDNYFAKNKFDCQLNAEQVSKLCKLFTAARKNKSTGKTPGAGALTISEQQKKRKRAENSAGQGGKNKRSQVDAKQDNRKRRVEDYARRDRDKKGAQVDARQDRNKKRAQDYANEVRNKRSAHVDTRLDRQRRRAKDDRRRSPHARRSPLARHPLHTVTAGDPRPVVVYERGAYAPEPLPSYVPEPVPAVSYATVPRSAVSAYGLNFSYGRTLGTDVYRQDAAIGRTSVGDIYRQDTATGRTSGGDVYRHDPAIGRDDQRVTYSALRYLDEERSDPYQYANTEPVYAYRDPHYLTSTRPDYYSSAASQEYLPSSSRASYYEAPLPAHRRY